MSSYKDWQHDLANCHGHILLGHIGSCSLMFEIRGWGLQYRSMDRVGWWTCALYIVLVLCVAHIMMNLFTAVLKLKLAKAMSVGSDDSVRCLVSMA
jgi:hypothetical protein